MRNHDDGDLWRRVGPLVLQLMVTRFGVQASYAWRHAELARGVTRFVMSHGMLLCHGQAEAHVKRPFEGQRAAVG